VLLDRLLDNAENEIAPFVVCEVRRGVRVEIPATDAPLLHCVVRGHGMQWTREDDAAPLAPASLSLIPPRTPCFIEPLGGSSRRVSLDAAGTSDHVARLIAGGGEAGLVIVSARLRGRAPNGVGSFDALRSAVVVDLSDVDGALSLLERVEAEQRERRVASRRMIELLLEQCLIHALGAILRTPSAAHSLRSLAETAALPRAAFSARFAQAFGSSPLSLLDQVRARHAARARAASGDGVEPTTRVRKRPERASARPRGAGAPEKTAVGMRRARGAGRAR
jgi:AraC family transcriptional activator of mtrCDE